MSGITTKAPCKAALIGERHVRIEISDFVMRTFVLAPSLSKLLRHLHAARAVGRCDMTTEAAVTKLYYLFSCGYPKETIKKLMTTNLCGEISV